VNAGGSLVIEPGEGGTIAVDGACKNENTYVDATSSMITVSGGTFTIKDGVKLYNGGEYYPSTDGPPGGILTLNGGAFNMEGGVLTGGRARYGGGVNIISGVMTMSGSALVGDLSNRANGNYTSGNGGGVYLSGGSLVVKDTAQISYNEAGSNGGAVYLTGNDAELILENGSFIGNYAKYCGGAVQVSQRTTFTMKNGLIKNNIAQERGYNPQGGGGVYVNGTFSMEGGSIENNVQNGINSSSTYPGGFGGGVFAYGTVTVKGDAKIINNTVGGTGCLGAGVYFYAGTFDFQSGTIANNSIYVSQADDYHKFTIRGVEQTVGNYTGNYYLYETSVAGKLLVNQEAGGRNVSSTEFGVYSDSGFSTPFASPEVSEDGSWRLENIDVGTVQNLYLKAVVTYEGYEGSFIKTLGPVSLAVAPSEEALTLDARVWSISKAAMTNGSAAIQSLAMNGDTISLKVTPASNDYRLTENSVYYDDGASGAQTTLTGGVYAIPTTSYPFTMPSEAVTLHASFRAMTPRVSVDGVNYETLNEAVAMSNGSSDAYEAVTFLTETVPQTETVVLGAGKYVALTVGSGENRVVQRQAGFTGNMIEVSNGAGISFNITSGGTLTLDGNKAAVASSSGALLYMNYGTSLTLPAGLTLKDNNGNGVTTGNSGQTGVAVTMAGATVTRNTSAGIRFQNYGSLSMTSGEISYNGNYGVYCQYASCNISGGTVNNNGAGGVWIEDNVFTLSGTGDISYNTGSGVTIYDWQYGDLYAYINGGTITHNTTSRNGGGIIVYSSSTFMATGVLIFNGGTISDNVATNGGGVYVSTYCEAGFGASGATDIENNIAVGTGTVEEPNGLGGGVWAAYLSGTASDLSHIRNNTPNQYYDVYDKTLDGAPYTP
jgi:hypothetical protein